MLNNLHNLILSKKNILISTGTKHNADVIFSALALHMVLNEANINNHLFSSNIERSKIWRNRLSHFPSMSVSSQLPTNYSFTLPKEIDVKDIKWRKEKGRYEVNIRSTSSDIKIDPIELKKSDRKFDLLIFIGNKSQISYENTGLTKEDYNKIDKVLIFSKRIFINGGPIEYDEINNNKCFSYKIIKMAKELELNINKDTATILLSGIISHTDGFKKNVKSLLFNSAYELLNKDVDYQLAHHIAIADLNIKKMVFLGNLFSRVKLIAPNIYHAGVMSRSDLNIRVEVSEMMKISEIYDCKFGIISIGTPMLNKIYLHSRTNDIDLKSILREFKGKGNNKQGVIETKDDLKDVLKRIYKQIGISDNTIAPKDKN